MVFVEDVRADQIRPGCWKMCFCDSAVQHRDVTGMWERMVSLDVNENGEL